MTYRCLKADIGIAGKYALVTGSIGGIGYATARALAGQGCHVMLHGLADPTEGEQKRKGLADECHVRVGFNAADLSDIGQIQELVRATEGELGPIEILANIVIPQALPGIIATSVFAFVAVWDDFLYARILLGVPTMQTMPVGLQDIYESTIVDWGLLMSGSVIVTIPAMIFFLIVQRFLIQGWGIGALKG